MARRLRQRLRDTGTAISHSAALEMLAHQFELPDWNTLRALSARSDALHVGQRVKGQYLGQEFTGAVRAVATLGDGAHRRITLHFDNPVDVVRFDSFSALRQRVSGVIGWDGRSARKTSDGMPQLIVMAA